MRDPNTAIPEESQPAAWRRYDQWRAQRHLDFNRKYAGRMNSWRNRRGARRLVLIQAALVVLLLLAAIASYVTSWFMVPFAIGVIGMIWTNGALRIVTGSVADSPAPALDEIQMAQRNAARSIGFFVVYSLMFIPYIVLVALSISDTANSATAYGTAVLLISLLVAALAVPTALTAWWFTAPDPDDVESYPDQFDALASAHFEDQIDNHVDDQGGHR